MIHFLFVIAELAELAVIAFLAFRIAKAAFVPIERWKAAPFVPTPKRRWKAIGAALELKAGETVYDLGSGHGGPLAEFVRGTGARGVGYELAWFPRLWSRARAWAGRLPLEIRARDFFSADLGRADAVFCYLLPHVLGDLEPKFERELRPGTRVVTFGFRLPGRVPDREIVTNPKCPAADRIFVYRY